MTKPVAGFIAGRTAPPGRRMGHAGAIISQRGDSAAEKTAAMAALGMEMAASASDLGSVMARVLGAVP